MGIYKALLLDFDGVISATNTRQEAWFKHWCDEHNQPWPFKGTSDFMDAYNGALGSPEGWQCGVQSFYDSLGVPCSMEDTSHFVWDAYRAFKAENPVGLKEGMEQVITTAYESGYILGVNSSNEEKNIKKELGDLVDCFSSFVTMDRLRSLLGDEANSRKKPDPFPVQQSLAELGVDASEAYFLGDTSADLFACKRAGVAIGGVLWGYESKTIGDEHVDPISRGTVKVDHVHPTPEHILETLGLN